MRSKKDLMEKLATMSPKQFYRWLSWILSFGAGITITVFIFYFLNFHGELTTDHERWGTFGDFVGGTLNPILSFLGLIALLLTLVLQNKQLKISSRELRLSRREMSQTRHEIKRSAAAQEKTELAQVKQAKALEISAKISAITQLMAQDKDTIQTITQSMEPLYGTRVIEKHKIGKAEESINNLQNNLRELYLELIDIKH